MSPRSVSYAFRGVSALLIVAIALTLAACGSSKKTTPLTKDAQLGLAYGAFKTYIAAPAVRGDFKPGSAGRSAAIKQARVAATVAINALNGAKARATTDDSLKQIAPAINATATAFGGLPIMLRRKGDVNAGTLGAPLSTLASLTTVARAHGIDITYETITPADLQTTR